MTAPDRPTREQVDAAVDVLALAIDESVTEFVDLRASDVGFEADPRTAARVAVEALLAQPEVLAVLAARIPQPAEPQHNHLSRGVYADPLGISGTDWDLSAPLPAVPDGEDGDLRARWLAHVAEHGIGPGPVLPPSPVDGEDVPARLDAAADALGALGLEYNARLMRELAEAAKVAHPDVRAAVAAALARPVEVRRG